MNQALDQEIQRNLFAFLPRLADLLPANEGQFALLRNQQIDSVHERLSDALRKGYADFADGIFSIQKVTDRPVELGMFGHADTSG